jgi:glutamyl-Q tRNA(Asp) synthetase
MTDARPVFRFAPSPNGELHLGHAFSALFTWEMARRFGGRFLLRIEDTDLARCREEFIAKIYEDLAWLGIEWEEPVRRQSKHFADHAAGLEKLRGLGLLYPCFASRKEVIEAAEQAEPPLGHDPDGAPLYPGLWRGAGEAEAAARIATGEAYALRLDMAKALALVHRSKRRRQPELLKSMHKQEASASAHERSECVSALAVALNGGPIFFDSFDADGRRERIAARPERWGDVVLAGKDRPITYHLAVVIDDALQGVTHVTRGADLLAATDIHRLLQILLGLPAPLYCHHRLVLDETGRKLAKSHRDKSLRSLRAEGVSAAAIRDRLPPLP